MIIANLLLDIAAMKYAHLRIELASEGWYYLANEMMESGSEFH